MDAVDLMRMVALANGAISIVLSVLSMHYFLTRNPPKQIRQHVSRVTVTYTSFVVYGLVDVGTRFGGPFRWQLIALFIVSGLSVHAQLPLLSYERDIAHKSRMKWERRVTDK